MRDHVLKVLLVLYVALLTSAWWAAAWWGMLENSEQFKPDLLWAAAGFLTLGAVLFCIFYCAVHWDD